MKYYANASSYWKKACTGIPSFAQRNLELGWVLMEGRIVLVSVRGVSTPSALSYCCFLSYGTTKSGAKHWRLRSESTRC